MLVALKDRLVVRASKLLHLLALQGEWVIDFTPVTHLFYGKTTDSYPSHALSEDLYYLLHTVISKFTIAGKPVSHSLSEDLYYLLHTVISKFTIAGKPVSAKKAEEKSQDGGGGGGRGGGRGGKLWIF